MNESGRSDMCHCEEQSDEAICIMMLRVIFLTIFQSIMQLFVAGNRSLRFARDDRTI